MSVITDGNLINLLFVICATVISLALIQRAKTKPFELRRLPALDAIEEMVGRCTEMGKPVVSCGVMSLGSVSMAVLSLHVYAAELCAKNRVKNIYVAMAPQTIGVVRDSYRAAYLKHGAADVFDPIKDIRFYGVRPESKFPSGVARTLEEEQPGGFLGVGYGEAGEGGLAPMGLSIIGEVSTRVGAFRIGGSAGLTNIGIQAITCDYIIIGEENLALGAYVSESPYLMGSIVTHDVFRLIFVVLLILGLILGAVGNTGLVDLLTL